MTPDHRWVELSPAEKREKRFERWLSPPGATFKSPEAEEGYKVRVTRFINAIKLKEPDRVPVILPAGFFPAYYASATLKTVMYDYDELRRAWLKFLHEFELDSLPTPGFVFPGKVLESIGYKLYQWPGHGLADDVAMYQYVEGEYMKHEEYDALIQNPSDFLMRTFLPRSVEAFRAFKKLGPMTPFVGVPVFYISQFGDPEIRSAFEALLEAGREGMKWQKAVKEIGQAALSEGVPYHSGALCGAPFDLIGDMLRGTKGVMMDMFQRPEKLHEGMERIIPLVIDEAVGAADASGCPIVFMPLHKGPDGFMSNKQYETFYWPTFRKVMMGLIQHGLVPMPFAEGNYEPRLDIIKDMPKGTVIWHFETMDMAKAKDVLGGYACIAGNLAASVLCTGTPQAVKEGCRRLIETCAPGGGYILTAAAGMNKGHPENLRAMIEAAKEYGVYR